MSPILFEIKDRIAIITLNRPDKFNSFNRQMALQFQEYLDACAADPQVRCIVITGTGKAFSAGQDLGEITGENPVAFEKILSEHYNPIISKIRDMAKPVLAVVNGVAAGAGANIALCCDVVVAAGSANFIQAFSRIGLIPDSSGTFFLPRLVGFQKASALMMLGDKIDAASASDMGMIYKYFPDEKLMEEAMTIADKLAGLPTRGLGLTKQALNRSLHHNLHQQLDLEDELQAQAANTKDYKEGVAAFMEKRSPVFTGE